MSWRISLILLLGLVYRPLNAQADGDNDQILKPQVDIEADSNYYFVDSDSTQYFRLFFVGDIMQHKEQIDAAYDPATDTYDYSQYFYYVQPILSLGDLVIGNLETTFAGEPYTGYPQFSAPDELANAIRYGGINFLVTANNHSADKGKNGIVRTLDVLDQMGIQHTGTFRDDQEKEDLYPMVVERDGFKIAIFNYTFGTNGIPMPSPTEVNILSRGAIQHDMQALDEIMPDYTIVYLHWGAEYERTPTYNQKLLAKFCFEQGADLVVGSHPHVIQRIEEISFYRDNELQTGVVAYSLGNFVSNYEGRYKDGGAILEVELVRNNYGAARVNNIGFIPTYCWKEEKNGETTYRVLPIAEVEKGNIHPGIKADQYLDMMTSADDTRMMLGYGANEFQYRLTDDIVNDVAETMVLKGKPLNQPEGVEVIWEPGQPLLASEEAATTISEAEENDALANAEAFDKRDKPRLQTMPRYFVVSPINNPVVMGLVSEKKHLGMTPINFKVDIENYLRANGMLEEEVVAEVIEPEPEKTLEPEPEVVKKDPEPEKVISPPPPPKDQKKIDTVMLDVPKVNTKDTIFRVQFYALRRAIDINTSYYDYLKGYEVVFENDWNRYLLGKSNDVHEMMQLCKKLQQKGLPEAFVVAYLNEQRIAFELPDE